MSTLDEPGIPLREAGLVRLRLNLAYDGTAYSGWALQPGLPTVQGVLTDALRTVLRSDELRLVVAGRTDAGVHASGQVAHCDVEARHWQHHRDQLVRRLAGLLPRDIRVNSVAEVGMDFDARFAALWRRYHYRISDADAGPDPLRRQDTVGWKRSLDVTRMQQAAELLLGLNDFAAYCRRREGASTIRQLQRLAIVRTADLIEIDVQADAFCHSMVRSLVGALAAVGEGLHQVDWPARLLHLGRRSDEVRVAPARGLTLVEVGYPAADQLAERAAETRAFRSPPA
ncbi:MAG: tRNA pseudouridine(38-40) synthase TruA [Actinomycetota bacterium]|nr:tRNA pseudouridine(38-40) synthase TruA [Actinomycetota bacterium]MDQ2957577.1 tRNA pseudouridine(38-40) synthase TruA [Actinomycetota bacterium]